MKRNIKHSMILFGAMAFSLGIISVGHGFWTDRLHLEGDAEVAISVDVIDDIAEVTSESAIQMLLNNILPGLGESSDSAIQIEAPDISNPDQGGSPEPQDNSSNSRDDSSGSSDDSGMPEGGDDSGMPEGGTEGNDPAAPEDQPPADNGTGWEEPGGPADEGPNGPADEGPNGTADEGPNGLADEGPNGTADEGPNGTADGGQNEGASNGADQGNQDPESKIE